MNFDLVQINNNTELVEPKRNIPKVLTIAGSDPSGGAGIEADIKSITVMGCYGLTCIDGITIQNTMGVYGKKVTEFEGLTKILYSNFNNGSPIDAIKIGMMTEGIVQWFKSCYSHGMVKFLVVDPIISSSSGYNLAKMMLIKSAIDNVYLHATLLTPNFEEALKIIEILGHERSKYTSRNCLESFYMLAKDIACFTKCHAVLLKGGHMPLSKVNNTELVDVLYDPDNIDKFTIFKHGRIVGAKNTHGTGCTLSSAIASCLALGNSLQDAVQIGTSYVHNAMKFADSSLGKGKGPLNHIYYM